MNKFLKTVRVATAYPKVHIGNPFKNCDEILDCINKLTSEDGKVNADVLLFPELCVTGYTCGDLFENSCLLDDCVKAIDKLTSSLFGVNYKKFVVIGSPFVLNDAIYNCAIVINNGSVIGIVPKTFIPNYKEFYEKRWFAAAPVENQIVKFGKFNNVLFGTNILFKSVHMPELKIGIEICEDVWTPIPPSSFQAIAGATLLLNLSASNELVAKSEYRRMMIQQQSARCVASYAYCSCGPTESTSDLVFGGHCLISENGNLVAETEKFKDEDFICAEVDIEKLINERRKTPSFNDSKRFLQRKFETIHFFLEEHKSNFSIDSHPFIPKDPSKLEERCKEIFNIQICALAKRMMQVKGGKFVIGVSGGLDSTLALIVAERAATKIGLDPSCIDAVTMPGFGTSDKTLENASKLMNLLKTSRTLIDIKKLCIQTFNDIGHKPFGLNPNSFDFVYQLGNLPPNSQDVVFENVQARIRTMLLMSRGFVLGTGDLSELLLGWCTYNGDHMSMYNVNCSIPKTLVKFLVEYASKNIFSGEISETLMDIVETIISPELLPLNKDGEITHSTESIVGPYELHDFFGSCFIRSNFSPKKIAILAENSFDKYSKEEINKWLKVFLTKFFFAQFKRNCVPDGPKVGSVSLSPRGDWRMPSDAEVDGWIKDLDN